MPEQPTFDAFDAKRFRLTIKHEPASADLYLGDSLVLPDALAFTFSAQVDEETFRAMPEPLYTVRIEHDLNPWHRKVTGPRQRLRRLRDGLAFIIRKRILRQHPVERITYTVPNCEIRPWADSDA